MRTRIRTWMGLAIGISMLTAGAGLAAEARHSHRSPDLRGEWQLDPSRSDMPQRGDFRRGAGPDGEGPRGRAETGPGWGRGDASGRNNRGEGRFGRGAGRGERPRRAGFGRLPSFLHIEQTGDRIQLADSTGAMIEQIEVGRVQSSGPSADGGAGDASARQVSSRWHEGTLEIERKSPRGTMLQTFAVEDGGETLVVRMERKSDDSGPAREFKRVYRRVSGS